MTALAVSARTRKRLIDRGLDVLTWVVVAVMVAPVLWLVASSLQTDGNLARGTYNLLHPTFTAFRDMWSTVEFSRYLVNSLIICTGAGGGGGGGGGGEGAGRAR
jgi:multiple sugar transport system permease protein